jgi:hypothetical protein
MSFLEVGIIMRRQGAVVGIVWHIMSHFVISANSEIGSWHVDAWKQVEYGVKARLVSVSVEVAYADSMKGIDTISKDKVDEQLHLHLAGTVLSFAVSSLPLFSEYLGFFV